MHALLLAAALLGQPATAAGPGEGFYITIILPDPDTGEVVWLSRSCRDWQWYTEYYVPPLIQAHGGVGYSSENSVKIMSGDAKHLLGDKLYEYFTRDPYEEKGMQGGYDLTRFPQHQILSNSLPFYQEPELQKAACEVMFRKQKMPRSRLYSRKDPTDFNKVSVEYEYPGPTELPAVKAEPNAESYEAWKEMKFRWRREHRWK